MGAIRSLNTHETPKGEMPCQCKAWKLPSRHKGRGIMPVFHSTTQGLYGAFGVFSGAEDKGLRGDKETMRVLVACEYSGTVRDAFNVAGHSAMSCDLLPTDSPGEHYQGDIFNLDLSEFDLMIAHPPCTYLSNSGVCHLHRDIKRWPMLFDGAGFFKRLIDSPVPRIAVENPIMHKYAKQLIGGTKQSQVIQPWMFGHLEQKATCLWLKGLPTLEPTNNVKAQMMELPKNQRERLHYLPPGPDRWKLRSTTYKGIAEAMANQWGKL